VSIYFEPSSHYPAIYDTRYAVEPKKPSPPDYVYGPDLIEDLWKRITVYALEEGRVNEC